MENSVNERIKEIADVIYKGNVTAMVKCCYHLARSTFATFMLSNGCSIQNVSRMLGHTNLKQTLKYAEILEKDVRKDYDMIADKLKKR